MSAVDGVCAEAVRLGAFPIAIGRPGGCPRCGGPLSMVVGIDEDDGDRAEVAAAATCGCGYERLPEPLAIRPGWASRRKEILARQREVR